MGIPALGVRLASYRYSFACWPPDRGGCLGWVRVRSREVNATPGGQREGGFADAGSAGHGCLG
jgi:hypothetical protein